MPSSVPNATSSLLTCSVQTASHDCSSLFYWTASTRIGFLRKVGTRSLPLDFGWRLVQAGVLEHLGEVAHVDHVSIDRTLDEVLGIIDRHPSIGAARILRRRRDLGAEPWRQPRLVPVIAFDLTPPF